MACWDTLLWSLYICTCVIASDIYDLPSTHRISKRSTDQDSCEGVEIIITDDHVPGNCKTFHGNRCLCELNGGCRYDTRKDECYTVTDCTIYNGFAVACRAAHCSYDCSTKTCTLDPVYAGQECSENSGQCSMFCDDICHCHGNECQMTSDGSCKETKDITCPYNSDLDRSCGRLGAFYYYKGNICKNTRIRGSCSIDQTIAAVNLGGDSYVDDRGITYMSEDSFGYYDQHDIRMEFKDSPNKGFTDDEKALYATVVYADSTKREDFKCLVYNISLCGDGMYELTIKTIEIFDVLPGEKTFNILIDEEYVFAEVDVARLAGNIYIPIDLVLNFEVKKQTILVEGLPPIPIKNGTISLKLCFGECIFAEGLFEVGAFSIVKFDTPGISSNPFCKMFNGNHWNCVSSFCNFNQTSGKCTSKSSEEAMMTCINDEPCDKKIKRLEIMYLLDSSGSSQHPNQGKQVSKVFDEFQRLRYSANTLQTIFTGTKIGFALISDFSCHIWGTCVWEHDVTDGCYRRRLPLTEDYRKFISETSRNQLTTLYSINREPTLFGTMMALQDKANDWTPGNDPSVKKLIVIVTDAPLQYSKKGRTPAQKLDPKFDGSDSCWYTQIPELEDLDDFFMREGLALFLIVKNSADMQQYERIMMPMKVPRQYGFINEDTALLAGRMTNFILSL